MPFGQPLAQRSFVGVETKYPCRLRLPGAHLPSSRRLRDEGFEGLDADEVKAKCKARRTHVLNCNCDFLCGFTGWAVWGVKVAKRSGMLENSAPHPAFAAGADHGVSQRVLERHPSAALQEMSLQAAQLFVPVSTRNPLTDRAFFGHGGTQPNTADRTLEVYELCNNPLQFLTIPRVFPLAYGDVRWLK